MKTIDVKWISTYHVYVAGEKDALRYREIHCDPNLPPGTTGVFITPCCRVKGIIASWTRSGAHIPWDQATTQIVDTHVPNVVQRTWNYLKSQLRRFHG